MSECAIGIEQTRKETHLELLEPGEWVARHVEVLQPREHIDALDARDGVVREQQRLQRRQCLSKVAIIVVATVDPVVVQVDEPAGGREAVVRQVKHAQEAQTSEPRDAGDLVACESQLQQERVRAGDVPRQLGDAVARQVGAAQQRPYPARAALPRVRPRALGHLVVCRVNRSDRSSISACQWQGVHCEGDAKVPRTWASWLSAASSDSSTGRCWSGASDLSRLRRHTKCCVVHGRSVRSITMNEGVDGDDDNTDLDVRELAQSLDVRQRQLREVGGREHVRLRVRVAPEHAEVRADQLARQRRRLLLFVLSPTRHGQRVSGFVHQTYEGSDGLRRRTRGFSRWSCEPRDVRKQVKRRSTDKKKRRTRANDTTEKKGAPTGIEENNGHGRTI